MPRIDEQSIENMLGAIGRLRNERDQLQRDFEFVQLETRFKVEALQSKLVQSEKLNVEASRLSHLPDVTRKLQRANLGLLVSIQHMDLQNTNLRRQVVDIAESQELFASSSQMELGSMKAQMSELQKECTSKDEEIFVIRDELSMTAEFLEEERKQRAAVENDLQRMEVDLSSARDELVELRERCQTLLAVQVTAPSSDDAARALKDEIKELQGRVMRRTEQIGMHQHDIKRLETNMKLLEDRLEEVTIDLETAATEKAAMLEDCTVIREERDAAKKALECTEIELDNFAKQVESLDEQIERLRCQIAISESQQKDSDSSRVEEIAALVSVVAERDCRIKALLHDLKSAEATLLATCEQNVSLNQELNLAQEAMARKVEELQEQILGGNTTLSSELDKKIAELQSLSSELTSTKESYERVSKSLLEKESQLNLLNDQFSRLESDKNSLVLRLETFETNAHEEAHESSALRSVLEEECRRHQETIQKLEEDISLMKKEKETQLQESGLRDDEITSQKKEMADLLETSKAELEEQRMLYERLECDHQGVMSARKAEVDELQSSVASLKQEIEDLRHSLQDEVEGRKRDSETANNELQEYLEKHKEQSQVESALKKEIQQYQTQLSEIQGTLGTLQDKNATMEATIKDLSTESDRANIESDTLRKDLSSCEKALATLQKELATVKDNLGRSEKAGKTAEMNLILNTQQHERTVSTLQAQLLEHEKDVKQVKTLQQVVEDMREQINEMEVLLRAKNDEIEGNDDKFIE